MKLIKNFILFYLLVIFPISSNNKKAFKSNEKTRSDAIDSELMERLLKLDSDIKSKSLNNENKIISIYDNQNLKHHNTDQKISFDNLDNNKIDTEAIIKFNNEEATKNSNFEKERLKKNILKKEKKKKSIDFENLNDGSTTIKNSSSNYNKDFIKNKFEEINNFEAYILDEEKKLDEKSKEIIEKLISS